jgi:hypothetical protein
VLGVAEALKSHSFVPTKGVAMPTLSQNEITELQAAATSGNLAACDRLAGHLYDERKYVESSKYYLMALRADFYKVNACPQSEANFFRMVDSRLIPGDSEAARYVSERRLLSAEIGTRTNKAASAAGIAVFIGYSVLVYGGGVTGLLRDFSLVIAAALAWGAWKLVLSTFNSDT